MLPPPGAVLLFFFCDIQRNGLFNEFFQCAGRHSTCFRKNIPIRYLFGLVLVIAGASSNLIDRVFFGFTIDYLRILTSVINVADIMIISGVLILLLPKKERGKLRFGKAYVKSQSP